MEEPRPLFAGDIQVQDSVRINRDSGAVRAVLKKLLMNYLRPKGNYLSAASVEIAEGKSVLVLGAPDVVGQLHVNQLGEGCVEIVAEENDEDRVDPITESFLTIKAAQYESGEANLRGPLSVEDWEAIGADSFAEVDQLLKK